jgi:glycosyltransferase involved in cell wall biosynthesis
MPTFDRPALVVRAVKYFLEQNYRDRELVVVDDGPESVRDLVTVHPDIRHVRLESRHTIGAKTNIGCQEARGEIVAQWDDDDWHGPDRLAIQVEPILNGSATVTALDGAPFYDIDRDLTWSAPRELLRDNRMDGMQGGTLVYLRKAWETCAGYPDLNFAEQITFLDRVLSAGGKLALVANRGDFVVIRHGRNTWRDPVLGIAGWSPVNGMPWLPAEALAFYRSLGDTARSDRR